MEKGGLPLGKTKKNTDNVLRNDHGELLNPGKNSVWMLKRHIHARERASKELLPATEALMSSKDASGKDPLILETSLNWETSRCGKETTAFVSYFLPELCLCRKKRQETC